MAGLIETLYQHALLADAAYLDGTLIGEDLIRELGLRGFTSSQGTAFDGEYNVVSFQPDTGSGFFATLYSDRRGKQIIAIRGTEPETLGDLLAGLNIGVFGSASGQYADLKNFIAAQRANGNLNSSFTVTGHSLGGHLATLLQLDDDFKAAQDITVEHVYTYNGPGVGFGLEEGSPSIGALFVQIAEIVLDRKFDEPLAGVTNLYGTAGLEITAGGGVQFGETVPLYSENQGFSLLGVTNHFIQHLTNSLSVYRIFDRVSPLGNAEGFKNVHDIFASTSIGRTTTLQTVLEDFGSLFGISTDNQSTETTDEFLAELNVKLQAFPSTAKFRLTKLVDTATGGILENARRDDPSGIAYRYALLNLDPFVAEVVDEAGAIDTDATRTLYSAHSADGALDLEQFSENFLADRAQFLVEKLKLGDTQFDFGGSRTKTIEGASDNVQLIDVEQDIAIQFEEPKDEPGRGSTPTFSRIAFGGNQADIGIIDGDALDDRIYGRGGDDEINGRQGDDYLEGNKGVDELVGGKGKDELVGGEGEDVLIGGETKDTDDHARDILKGGANLDTYHVGNGDVIEDSDRQGTIQINGLDISGSYVRLTENSYRNETTGIVIAVDGTRAVVVHIDNEITTSFTIENFRDADTGFNDGDFGISLGETPPDLGRPIEIQLPGDPGPAGRFDDEVVHGTGENETIHGNYGSDVIRGEGGDDLIASGRFFADFEQPEAELGDYLFGGAGKDTAVGSRGSDRIFGGEGTDFLSGRQGDDAIDGGADADVLSGGPGMDALSGGAGADLLFGGWDVHTWLLDYTSWSVSLSHDAEGRPIPTLNQVAGSPIDLGELGTDFLFGGDGDDILFGGTDRDWLHGEADNDFLAGGPGDDVLSGGTGIDTLYGDWYVGLENSESSDDELHGGDGDDKLYGERGDDRLYGDAGMDALFGGEGDDLLQGGADNDVLDGGSGNDTLDGGTGDDIYQYDSGDLLIRDPSGTDRLIFRSLPASALQLNLAGEHLQILTAADTITIENWTTNPIESFEFLAAGGGSATVLDSAAIEAAINHAPTPPADSATLALAPGGPDTGALIPSDEFAVATNTANNQQRVSVAGLGDGGFVAVWVSLDPVTGDSGIGGIVGQRFDERGNRVGTEFSISADAIFQPTEPQVIGLEDGGYVVTWANDDPASADPHLGIVAQRFDAQDSKLGSQFLVNTRTQGVQIRPSIEAFADGGFIIAWASTDPAIGDSDRGISGQRFDSAGDRVGGEFLINTATSGLQFVPEIGRLADGGFVVAWSSPDPANPAFLANAPRAQRFDGAGNAVGGEVVVNQFSPGFLFALDVAGLADGGYVVTWLSSASEHGNTVIAGRRFAAEGNPLGGEFIVSTHSPGGVGEPTVAALDDGGFVVTWQSVTPATGDLDSDGIAGQRYDAQGNRFGTEFLVNVTTALAQRSPAVTALADGGFAVVWETEAGALNTWDVAGRVFQAPSPNVLVLDVLANDTDPDPGDAPGDLSLESVTVRGDRGLAFIQDNSLRFEAGRDFDFLALGETADVRVDYVVADSGGLRASSTATITIEGTLAPSSISGSDAADTLTISNDHQSYFGLAGDDTINVQGGLRVVVDGGEGNDSIRFVPFDSGGRSSTLTARGGPGDDRYIVDGAGYDITIDDSVAAGAGNSLVFGDRFSGESIAIGIGSLKISLGDGAGTVHLENFDPNDVLGGPRTIDRFEFSDGTTLSYEAFVGRGFDIDGSNASDNLVGTNIDDRLRGFAGADVLSAGAGDDELTGGAGTDRLEGGQGDDIYHYAQGDGVDTLRDAGGTDTVRFGEGVAESAVSFSLSGDNLRVRLDTGGLLLIQGWLGRGGNRVERFEFEDGAVVTDLDLEERLGIVANEPPVLQSAIPDQAATQDAPFSLQLADQTFVDPDTDDTLSLSALTAAGEALPAWLSFNPLTRTFSGTPPAGSAGVIELEVSATDPSGLRASDRFNLTISDPSQARNLIVGGDGKDKLKGTPEADLIQGLDGKDKLTGRGANDVLEGGSGDDRLDGGAGDDALFGGAGKDHLKDKKGDNILDGGEGKDKLESGKGNDQLFGGPGDDDLKSGDGDDLLDGGEGNDKLKGEKGDDRLFGGAGDDDLKAGDGNNLLAGGPGEDKLDGGKNDDIYLFGLGDGQDRIKEHGGDDLLRFGGSIAPQDLWVWQDKNDLNVGIIGADDRVTIADWFKKPTHRVESLELTDGGLLIENQVAQLVQAMAVFEPSSSGVLNPSQAQQDEVAAIIAAAWQ
jgi:Ca2+-binding RTX toxin-like protein